MARYQYTGKCEEGRQWALRKEKESFEKDIFEILFLLNRIADKK